MVNEESIERAAYLAANQIDAADLGYPKYAFPGTRRSKRLDAIARIIKEVMVKEMGMQLEAAGVRIDHEVVPFYEVPMDGVFLYMGDEFTKKGANLGIRDGNHYSLTIGLNTKVRLITR